MKPPLQLEPDVESFLKNRINLPELFELGSNGGREMLNTLQGSQAYINPVVDVEDRIIRGGPNGRVSIRLIRPHNIPAALPAILFIHGGGWVFGNAHTHNRLIRSLAIGTNAVVVFPHYSQSPEAKYPVALEECYTVAKWIFEQGISYGIDSQRIAVAGDDAGGNLAAALTILAKERGGPVFRCQLLFYPILNAIFDSGTYQEFGEAYFLTERAMRWCWEQYTCLPSDRTEVTTSLLAASIEQLHGLPVALIITAYADVLRDEGRAYAGKLRQAGVRVTLAQFAGTIHDFVLLDALAHTRAARGALFLASVWIRNRFYP